MLIDMYVPCWTELIAEPFVYRSMLFKRFQELDEELSIHLNSLEIRSQLSGSNVFDLGYSDSYFRGKIREINEMNRIGMHASGAGFSGSAYPMLNEDDFFESSRILQKALEQFEERYDNQQVSTVK